MTAKLALAIHSIHAPAAWINYTQHPTSGPMALRLDPVLWYSPTTLEDRATCETDPSLLQLLPYIMLARADGAIFVYSRGKGGGEQRLHAALSLGVGGHIDDNVPAVGSLKEWCRLEAQREILEEVGVNVEPHRINFTHMLCDPTNEVGRVHLGLFAPVLLNEAEWVQMALEEHNLEHGRWLRPEELFNDGVFERLEGWSQAVATLLAHQLNDF